MLSTLAGLIALFSLSLLLYLHSLAYRSPPREPQRRDWQKRTKIPSLALILIAPLAIYTQLQPMNSPLLGLYHTLLGLAFAWILIESLWIWLPTSKDWRPLGRAGGLLFFLVWLIVMKPDHGERLLALATTLALAGLGLRFHQKLYGGAHSQSRWLRNIRRRTSGITALLIVFIAIEWLIRGWTVVPIRSGQLRGFELLIGFTLAWGVVEVASVSLEHFLFQHRRRSADVAQIASDGVRALLYLALGTLIYRFGSHGQMGSLALSSAVFSIALGLALKPTLGNFVSGLVVRGAQDFEIGDLVQIGQRMGLVQSINWHSLRLGTLEFDSISLPHSQVARQVITNFSRPSPQHACYTDFRLHSQYPPSWVREQVERAMQDLPEVATYPQPEVYLMSYQNGFCCYRIRWWLEDIIDRPLFESLVRGHLSYVLERLGLRPALPTRQWLESTLEN